MPFINSIFSYEWEQDETLSDKFEYFTEWERKILNKQKKKSECMSEWKKDRENRNKRH